MKLIYVLDYIFMQTPDGRVWTDTNYDSQFWQPYLEVYSHVSIVSRVQPITVAQPAWKEVTGNQITVCALQVYRSAKQFLRQSSALHGALRKIFEEDGAVVLRVPSNLARCAANELDNMGKAYAVEVVGDPLGALAPGAVQMPGRPLLRQIFTRAQRRICRNAIGVSYVAQLLRDLYPESCGAPSLVCSDVRLDHNWLRSHARSYQRSEPVRLLTVATLSQTYKGLDVLLDAMKSCKSSGLKFTLTIVGTGRYHDQLKQQAVDLGIADTVHFAGAIPWGPQLISCFDEHDLFVLPSRVEVMPRALLEAMARALPAIATSVGAVSEVLPAGELIQPGNSSQLAEMIVACATRPELLNHMSARNLARAQQFSSENLSPLWRHFHWQLRVRFQSHRRLSTAVIQNAAA